MLLRKKLLEADSGGDDPRVILIGDEIDDLMRIYFPERSNEAKTKEEIDALVRKAAEYGFLQKLEGELSRFEVKRVIKALFNAAWLSEVGERLKECQTHANRAA